MWFLVFQAVESRTGEGTVVNVLKVKAHNEGGINSCNALQTFGNIVADKLADSGACFNFDKAQQVSQELEIQDRLAVLVINRLTKIALENARFLGRKPASGDGTLAPDLDGAGAF